MTDSCQSDDQTMSGTAQDIDIWSDDCIKYKDHVSLKRNVGDVDGDETKKLRNNEYEQVDLIDKWNDDQENDDDYQELTEEERKILSLSNQLVNFSMNFVPLPDWPDDFATVNQEPSTSNSTATEFPPESGQVIHGYYLSKLLCASKRTAIFIGHKDKKPEEEVIIKIGFEMGFHSLQSEHNNYGKLRGSKAVVKVLDYTWWRVYRNNTSIRWGLIALEKCGPNLIELMDRLSSRGGPIVGSLFEIAIKMIDAIEAFHDKGFIHCSLKPEHFILENDLNPNCLKLIGLSASKSYLRAGTSQHVEEQSDRKLPKGDPNFHSIGYHNGFRRSRRDDMESLGYCLVYLAKGSLPWMQPEGPHGWKNKVILKIGNKMAQTSLEEMCQGLPNNFLEYFKSIELYNFADRPNYEELRNNFRVHSP